MSTTASAAKKTRPVTREAIAVMESVIADVDANGEAFIMILGRRFRVTADRRGWSPIIDELKWWQPGSGPSVGDVVFFDGERRWVIA